jgi:hypothetical protein
VPGSRIPTGSRLFCYVVIVFVTTNTSQYVFNIFAFANDEFWQGLSQPESDKGNRRPQIAGVLFNRKFQGGMTATCSRCFRDSGGLSRPTYETTALRSRAGYQVTPKNA